MLPCLYQISINSTSMKIKVTTGSKDNIYFHRETRLVNIFNKYENNI
jgi:hypothetical protein